MPPIVNIAAYKFAKLDGLVPLREELLTLTARLQTRGSILLSPEGINCFVAGEHEAIDELLARLRQVPGLDDLQAKESLSREKPFNRMLVKIKREIIAFGVEGIDPLQYTSRRLTARELKQWLDEGRPFTLLDTRNDFEIELGTFEKAVAIHVDDFRDFPKAVGRLPEEWKDRPVVTFCTGGIRCEKAAPYLEREGFREVYQLDGGILKYLEECGGAHYQGNCFVFDQRVAVDAALTETEMRQCHACRAILPPGESSAEDVWCDRCNPGSAATGEALIALRHQAIREATATLPGSVPYENVRPISVPLHLDGFELLDFLDAMHTHLSRDAWRQVIEEGRLFYRDEPVRGRVVRSGERFFHHLPAMREPDVAANIEIVHEDNAIIVVNKPAPLPMHPCGRFNRNSLSSILDQVYRPLALRPAHRLDADTCGLVVFCKTREAAKFVQSQFESGQVRKTYLARVHGRPAEESFDCHSPISGRVGPGGMRVPDENGANATTRFRVLSEAAYTTLLEIEPLTGRTNQIRVHLWKLDLPIVGDPIYLQGGQLGTGRTLAITEPPLCLQAARIAFVHPGTKEVVRFESEPPDWMETSSAADHSRGSGEIR
jgi:RluA family pseudouridine synthase